MELIVFITLLALGYFFGILAEKKHFKSINKREKLHLRLPTTSLKRPLGTLPPVTESSLVSGNVVISVDYCKRILAGLRNIFGGQVSAYETLVDRARREAILRMKESCPNATQLINLRIETSSISKGAKQQIGSVEVLAYGTALYCRPDDSVYFT
ncbi:MAG: heavy metal-binding domain-containing protein [Desulfobulbaceae bacterium]|jgi:uncharacterized protein YbjQ (UPF0145 family)|nr:heavy metal-binding domain-containing protein [Desulfobulbaceae bacterium]